MKTCEVALPGCTPTPLANYLKALGVLRLVSEQADSEARGCWHGGHFALSSALDRDGLEAFFLDRYAPTPVIAPWNGGSGFYIDDNRAGIDALSTAVAPRFAGYVATIATAERARDALNLQSSPKKEAKAAFLQRLRGELPDEALPWFDAAVLLGSDQVLYPPLLGTGGNDGRLDFTNNFMQRLVELLEPATGQPSPVATPLLRAALFGEPTPGLAKAAVGQFAPGAAGGPNATAGFEGDSRVNPWDFVLMLEGALLFAAAATRRNEIEDTSALSFPFTVRATAAGSGHAVLADEGSSRAELWMPLWAQPAALTEIRALLAEGRVTLGRRPVRDGLDFVRAVAKLGVDRGITRFQRYGLMMRSGKAFLATPLTQVRVVRNTRADLIDQLDGDDWLHAFRRLARHGEAPARLKGIGRRLDQALFDLAAPGGKTETAGPAQVQAALVALGEAVGYLARSPKARDAVRSVPRIEKSWTEAADDESDEFRLAAAIAGLGSGTPFPPLLAHIAPIADRGGRWADTTQQRVVWNEAALVDNLVRVLRRRLIDAERDGAEDKPFGGKPGADLAAIAGFLSGKTDDGRIDDDRIDALARGLALVTEPALLPRRAPKTSWPLPAAYAALKPLFMPDATLQAEHLLGVDARLPIPAGLVGQLTSGEERRAEGAIRQAQTRARSAGLGRSFNGLGSAGINGRRLAAALLIPIRRVDVSRLVAIAYPTPETPRPAALQEGSLS